ncbi:MAG: hypothetical protein ACOC43_09335 [Desulfohalobiaceae bacterium]
MSSIAGNYNLQETMLGSLQQPQQTQQSTGLSKGGTQNLLQAEGDASSFSNYAQQLSEIDQDLRQTGDESAREGFRDMVQEFARNPGQSDLDAFVQANNSMETQDRQDMASTAREVAEQGNSEQLREFSNQASAMYNQDTETGNQFVQATNQVLEVSNSEQQEAQSAEQNLQSFLELSSRTEQARDDQSMLQEFMNDVQSAEDNDQLQGVYDDYYDRLSEAV